MNILHDISDDRIKPDEFVAVIEIPTGTKVKYEIDKETGLLMLDRIPPTGMRNPMNYGFIPRTHCEDGDALDVYVVTAETLEPMSLVVCKPVGLMRMIDNGEADEKIIAVPVKDPNNDLPKNIVAEIYHQQQYLKAHNPKNKVELSPLEGVESAKKMISEAKALYKKTFGGKK